MKVRVNIFLDKELNDKLDGYQKIGIPKAVIVRTALRRFFSNETDLKNFLELFRSKT